MTYATEDQLVERFGARMLIDLTDRGEVATGEIDSDTVAAALVSTDAMIDGYLQGSYAMPLATVPPLLTDIALSIAIWRLHIGIPGDKIAKDYDDARKSLAQIAQGLIKLGVAGVQPAGSGTSGAQVVDRERPFTESTMKGFI